MRRAVVAFMLVILTVLWTGCSEINHSSSNVVTDLESEIKLNGNSLIPNEFLQEDAYRPLNYSIQQAMWFTYMDYEYILLNKTEEEFTKAIVERFVKAKSMGIILFMFRSGHFVMRIIIQSCIREVYILRRQAVLIRLL